MINVKVTTQKTLEDFVAVETQTGASTIPGKHIFGIMCVGVISVLLALPFGALVPENASPFAALTAGREEQNRKYEEAYLSSNENAAEESVEITQNAGSEENYDDYINTEELIAQSADSSSIKLPQAPLADTVNNRRRFTADDTEDTAESTSEKSAETYISNILTPDNIPGTISKPQAESEMTAVVNGTWYEQTVRRGDSLSKIFSYLSLKSEDLEKISAVAQSGDLNLAVGDKIQMLIDENNVLREIAIPTASNKQVRFSRDMDKNTFTVARERKFAQFSDLKSRSMSSATMMPSFIEAEKERAKERMEKELMLAKQREAEKQAKALKAKELAEKKALEKKHQEELLAQKKAEEAVKPIYTKHNRPRLIIGSIGPKETFDRAATRYGLTRSDIVTIKNQYQGKINFRRLKEGDSFRILFNGIGQGSSMTAVSMNTARYGNKTLYRNQQNHIFYEEDGYTPSAGAFRRFPITGQIKVSSPFNLHRLHPIRHVVRPHYGVDFKLSIGTPIYAPADGVVSYAKYMRGGGYTIILNHKGGYSTVYMHLSKFDVRQGDQVHIGQMIAKSGNTGNSTGAHLHYEVHVNGRPVDPLKVDLPSGSPAVAQRLKEAFRNNVKVLKSELHKNKLAEVR